MAATATETAGRSPTSYVPQVAPAVDCSAAERLRAWELCEQWTERHATSGKKPTGLAAACVSAAADQATGVTQSAVADVACVTPVTARKRWDELLDRPV